MTDNWGVILGGVVGAVGLLVAVIAGWDKIRTLWFRSNIRILIFAIDKSYSTDELRALSPEYCPITLHPLLAPKHGRDAQNAIVPVVCEHWSYPPLTVICRLQFENTGKAAARNIVLSLHFRHGEGPSRIGRMMIEHPDRIGVIHGGEKSGSFVTLRAASLLPNERQEVQILTHPCDGLQVEAWDANRRPIRNIYAWQFIFAVNKSPLALTVTRGGIPW